MSPVSFHILSGIVSAAICAGIIGYFLTLQFLKLLPELRRKLTRNIKPGPVPRLTRAQMILVTGCLLGLLLMVLDDFFTGLLFVLLAVLCGYGFEKGPAFLKKQRDKKLLNQLSEVFPQALGMSIQALKTGQTVPQVLDYLSREAPAPLRGELSQVRAEIEMGSSTDQALSKMAERFPDFSEFYQFLESYKISRQTGANLTHLLEVLLEGMEEKNRILRKMEAMTAQARLSGLLMGILPLLLGLVFFLMDPNLIEPLFTERSGWAILLLAAILETIGFLWIRQLLRVEF